MAGNTAEVAKLEEVVENVDKKSENDLHEFAEYYKNASDKEKKSLDEKYNQYFKEEMQKDSELNNKLNNSEKKESAEIGRRDVENLYIVWSLTEALNQYPNISSPEYRAVKKIVDEYTQNLSKEAENVLRNKENVERNNDNHD